MARGDPCHMEETEWPPKNLVCLQSSVLMAQKHLIFVEFGMLIKKEKEEEGDDSVPRD